MPSWLRLKVAADRADVHARRLLAVEARLRHEERLVVGAVAEDAVDDDRVGHTRRGLVLGLTGDDARLASDAAPRVDDHAVAELPFGWQTALRDGRPSRGLSLVKARLAPPASAAASAPTPRPKRRSTSSRRDTRGMESTRHRHSMSTSLEACRPPLVPRALPTGRVAEGSPESQGDRRMPERTFSRVRLVR